MQVLDTAACNDDASYGASVDEAEVSWLLVVACPVVYILGSSRCFWRIKANEMPSSQRDTLFVIPILNLQHQVLQFNKWSSKLKQPRQLGALLVATFLLTYLVMGYIGGAHVPGYVYNGVDEACKALLGVWIALCLTSHWKRLAIFGVGIFAFTVLPHIWAPTKFYQIYISNTYLPDWPWPGYAINHFYAVTIHFTTIAVVFLYLHAATGLRLTRMTDIPPLEWTGQYSIKTLLVAVLASATLLGSAKYIRSLVDGNASSYAIFAFDSVRLVLVVAACLFYVFVARQYRLLIAIVVFGSSVGICLLTPYAFRLGVSMLNWVAYAIIQVAILILSFRVMKRAGFNLASV